MRRALVILAVVALPAPAGAGEAADLLARARAEVEQLRYDVAHTTLARALEAGDADRDELVAIYRLAGEVAGSLDKADAARDHFQRLLALDPTAELDKGVSPKIARPFAAARTRAAKAGPLAARDTRRDRQLTVEVTADPLKMVARARLYVHPEEGPPAITILDGTARFEATLPAEARAWSVALLDRHGNQLLLLRREVPHPVMLPPPPPAEEPPGPAWYARWHPWAGLAVGLATGGVGLGMWVRSIEQDIDDLNRNSSEHDFSETQPLERKGKRVALAANLCFAAAATSAIVSGVFYFKKRRARRTEVAATPLPGGAAVQFTLSW